MAILRLFLNHLPSAEYAANPSRGRAWQAKQRVSHGKRGVFDEVAALVREQGWTGPPFHRARIRVTFGLPDQRRRDADGLQARMKPYFDALIQVGVIEDDDLQTIGWPEYGYFLSRRQPQTIIEVFGANQD